MIVPWDYKDCAAIFPDYAPTPDRLRYFLLFYHGIVTFVPEVDQQAVLERNEITEISAEIDRPVRFVSPRELTAIDFGQVAEAGERLLSQIDVDVEIKRLISESYCWSHPPEKRLSVKTETAARLLKLGWKPIAYGKAMYEVLVSAVDIGLAMDAEGVELPGAPTYARGYVVHPELYRFFLSRHAANFASHTQSPAVTFSDECFFDAAYDGRRTDDSRSHIRNLLLNTCIELSVPGNISSLSPGEFFELRNELANIRSDFLELLDQITIRENLDALNSPSLIRSEISERAKSIVEQSRSFEGFLSKHTDLPTKKLAFNVIAVSSIGAIGAAFGGPEGAALASGATYLLDPSSTLLYPKMTGPSRLTSKKFAAIHASIDAGEKRSFPRMPNYYL